MRNSPEDRVGRVGRGGSGGPDIVDPNFRH